MFKIKYILLLFLFLSFAYSQEKGDSVLKQFPPVNVEAKRVSDNPHADYLAGKVLSNKEIELVNPWQASEAINMNSGIYIRNYGGLGGLKTISLRGGDAKQTIVMLDGVRINSNGSGIIDLSILPSSFFNSIEIIKGSTSSASGGTDGLVNFLTSSPDNKSTVKAILSIASFNEKKGAISGSFHLHKLYVSIDGEYLNSKGDFPFETKQFGETIKAKRQNGDFENLNLSASLLYQEANFRTFSRLIFRNSDRGSPGAVLQGHIESKDARLNETDFLFYSKNDYILDSLSQLNLNVSAKIGKLGYRDSSFYSIGFSDGKFNSKDAGISGRYIFSNSLYSNEFEMNYLFSGLQGAMINSQNGTYVSRHNFYANAKSELKMNFFEYYHFNTLFSSRLDYFSDEGVAFSPFMGFSIYKAGFPLLFKMAFSYNFRPPSFNEMYYFNYGNKDLKPEKQYSSSITLESEPFGNLNLIFSVFNNITMDKIIYIQSSPMSGITQNFGKVRSRGVEFEANYSLFTNLLEFSYNYTYQYVTDDLDSSLTHGEIIPYTPQELISGQILLKHKAFHLGSNVEYVSHRFTLGDNSYTSLLPAYFVMNAFLSYSLNFIKTDFTFRFDALNLLDEKYAIIKNYPMPGRMFRATLSIKI